MKNFIRKVISEKDTKYLMIMSGFSVFLSLCRIIYTARNMYAFLLWNLFLAFIPWVIANILEYKNFRKGIEIPVMIAWLLMFPNAPYLFTDLIHLGKNPFAPRWFDITLLLSYGITGFAFAYFSLKKVEGKIKKYFPKIKANYLKAFIIYLSSYGIYLGRFLRWNSWDIITNFVPLVRDVFKTIKHPVQNAAAWGFTILFGTLLNILFFILESVSSGSDSSTVTVDVEVY